MRTLMLSYALLAAASSRQLYHPLVGSPRPTRPEMVAYARLAPGATLLAQSPPLLPRHTPQYDGRVTRPRGDQAGISRPATRFPYFALGSAVGCGVCSVLAVSGRRAETEAAAICAAAAAGLLCAWLSGEVPVAVAVVASGLCAGASALALRSVRPRNAERVAPLPGARSPAWDPRELQAALCAAVIAGSTLVAPPPALAVTDSAAIGKCLIKNCPTQLARCVSDPVCAANLLCIQTCTDRPDESECQIKCGDEFANKVVDKFTSCAVSSKNCVPQRQDDGSWPVPTEAALVPFSPGMFTGDWYISAGLNKAFDTFDCQFHKFTSPAPNKFVGDLQWRIKNPLLENDFSTKTTIQEFVQDPKVPGILYNHDNEFLHYQDDWYVLAAKEDAYFVVYYRGSNDAWDGYGGAFVYSRSPKFPKQYSKEIDESLQKIGRSLKDFTFTDNSCKGKPTVTEELVFVESRVATGVASAETSFVDELTKDIQIAKDDVILAEKELAKDIRIVEDDIIAVEKELEKDVVNVEQEIVRDEQKFLNLFFKR